MGVVSFEFQDSEEDAFDLCRRFRYLTIVHVLMLPHPYLFFARRSWLVELLVEDGYTGSQICDVDFCLVYFEVALFRTSYGCLLLLGIFRCCSSTMPPRSLIG
jgi:hypothetical protein